MAVKIMDNRRQTMITDGDLLTPLLGGMNFREIGEMLRCIHNAKWRSDKRFDGFDLGFRCDDEVIWDYWTVGRKAGKEVAIWELTVRYSTFSSSRELFISHDYSRTLRVGRSTAYKARPASPPAEYDFWIDAGWIEGDRERAYKEIYDINQFSIRTVEAEKSAEKWLDSGFDIRVFCGSGCNSGRSAKVIKSDVLRAFHAKGGTLEKFRSALVCRSCGRKLPTIEPYEY